MGKENEKLEGVTPSLVCENVSRRHVTIMAISAIWAFLDFAFGPCQFYIAECFPKLGMIVRISPTIMFFLAFVFPAINMTLLTLLIFAASRALKVKSRKTFCLAVFFFGLNLIAIMGDAWILWRIATWFDNHPCP